ncbi:GGDEF domain-containing protein [Sulfurimonas sp. MAG313]|nr:GGDEF domain-containing protein [Sulfurimonas sp. MAG313]MDF1880766.1 GGDEF domain-containing protein [Sulfurimonas sp. MAG313]
MNEFLFYSLCVSEDIKNSLDDLGMQTKSFSSQEDLLSALVKQRCTFIVFHTEIGIDEIKNTLKLIENKNLSSDIFSLVLSDLEDNEALSLELKDFNVVSIFTYSNWKYQLIHFLKIFNPNKLNFLPNDLEYENRMDPLTDVLNWQSAPKIFDSLINDYEISSRPFSLIMFQIDDFKDVIDEFGKDIGDEVLVSLSNIVQQNIRQYDVVLRVDTDTFAIFLSGANLEISRSKAESFRNEIFMKGHGFDKVKVCASFSVIEYEKGESLHGLSTKAKTLMLQAHQKGGDTVVSS